MVPPAGKNDAQWVPPPSPLTMLVKAFSRISTKPVSTISNVVVARSQLLPHQPCRKRSGATESPTSEPPASTHTTLQPHHHGGAGTIATTRREGERPPAHPRGCCSLAARPCPQPLQAVTARSGQRQWQPAPATAGRLYHNHLAPGPAIPWPPRPDSGSCCQWQHLAGHSPHVTLHTGRRRLHTTPTTTAARAVRLSRNLRHRPQYWSPTTHAPISHL
jgi:hypothetical protein